MHLSLRSWAWILLCVYALSGLTGLAYEILWARMLSLQFGVSIFGVVVSVTAFMAGLGLGSILGLHYSHTLRNPLRLFALLEGGVALYALASPWLLRAADAWLGSAATQLSVWSWYLTQGSAALLLLLIPALALGAGFALMLKALSPASFSLGRIYGVNTCGGAVGALLPLWLLPSFGWVNAMQIVAGVGMVAALIALLFSTLGWARQDVQNSRRSYQRPSHTTLLAYAGVGAAALMLEVAWTRLFGMVLLRTEYVLAVILAVFVLGIGLGSLLVRRHHAALWLTVLPFAASGFALLSVWCLPLVSSWAEQAQFTSLFSAIVWQGLVLAAITLPVTLALGVWLPLLSSRLGEANETGPWLYGVNSVGSALGALFAGVVLLPWVGATGTACLAALLLFVCGMTWSRARQRYIIAGAGLIVLGLLSWPVRELPPVARLLPETQTGSKDLFRHEDALSITHVIERADGQRVLLTDLQRMDAATDQAAVAVQQNQARLPLLLHPAPRSVLFLGLGTGISASGAQHFPKLARSGVELSQGAIEAAQDWFVPVNDAALRHMRVTRDDARRFLRTDTRHYDVIIGDLFHPDLAGQSALLSVQQFSRARARLTDNGLFVQWIALNQFDAQSLAVVLRTFQHVFPDAVIFVEGFRLALVGPRGAFQGAPALLANIAALPAGAPNAVTGGEGTWTWLGRYWGKIPASAGPVQEEWAPRIEFSLPGARYRGELDLAKLLAELLTHRPAFAQAAEELQVAVQDRAFFERGYVATELALRGWLATLQGQAEGAALLRLAYEANPHDRWISFSVADGMLATLPQAIGQGMDKREALLTVLKIRSDHAEVLRALWDLERAAGNNAEAEQYRMRLQAVSPLDTALRSAH